jgi:hypothetical protein
VTLVVRPRLWPHVSSWRPGVPIRCPTDEELPENWRENWRTSNANVAICREKSESVSVSKTVGRRKAPRGFESHPSAVASDINLEIDQGTLAVTGRGDADRLEPAITGGTGEFEHAAGTLLADLTKDRGIPITVNVIE